MPVNTFNSYKTLGVLGGMGSYSSLNFYKRLLELTPAKEDQDYIRVIIDSNSKVPSRVDAILQSGEDPVPAMLESLHLLQNAGADLIAVPCNTSHYYFSSFKSAVTVPILNIIETAVSHISTTCQSVKYVGILASEATIKNDLYQKQLKMQGYQPLILSDSDQKNLINEAIYSEKGLKAGFINSENEDLVISACDNLIARGAEVIISGCSELPLVLDSNKCTIPLVDSATTLAQVCVDAILFPKVYSDVVESTKVKQTVHSNMLV